MRLIGNEDIWHQLSVANKSALEDGRPLPHTLLSGAAGCGKTSTARELARQSGAQFLVIAADSVKTRDDVLTIINRLNREGYDRYGDRKEGVKINYPILFIDEIHRLPITGQEHLGIVMEEWKIPVDGKNGLKNIFDKFDTNQQDRCCWSPKFTLIGATTNDGLLSKPFKDRFKMRFLFNTYTIEESIEIVKSHADLLDIILDDAAAIEIAKRGRGVPRIIVGLLERCRDFTKAVEQTKMDSDLARAAFSLFKIDDTGLTEVDIKILKALYKSIDPLGVDNMAIIANESKQAISETIEPYLIQRGLITRTPRGRTITNSGKQYLIKEGHIDIDIDNDKVDIPNNYERKF